QKAFHILEQISIRPVKNCGLNVRKALRGAYCRQALQALGIAFSNWYQRHAETRAHHLEGQLRRVHFGSYLQPRRKVLPTQEIFKDLTEHAGPFMKDETLTQNIRPS